MKKIVIVDYGTGNLRSVAQALLFAAPEADIKVSSAASDIRQACSLVLPGQGAMSEPIRKMHENALFDTVVEALRSRPVLAICIGLQMLFDFSEEGSATGLGLLPGKVVRFRPEAAHSPDGTRYKVPQIGWNRVHQSTGHALWKGIPDNSYFYFVHSYYAVPENPDHIAGLTEYGQTYCSAVSHENLFATQFHPEKSATVGLQLFQNFVNWNP